MYNLIGFMQKAHLIDISKVYSQHEKDFMLTVLMTEMEGMYKIPMFKNAEWEKHNQDVIKVYKFISNLRKL